MPPTSPSPPANADACPPPPPPPLDDEAKAIALAMICSIAASDGGGGCPSNGPGERGVSGSRLGCRCGCPVLALVDENDGGGVREDSEPRWSGGGLRVAPPPLRLPPAALEEAPAAAVAAAAAGDDDVVIVAAAADEETPDEEAPTGDACLDGLAALSSTADEAPMSVWRWPPPVLPSALFAIAERKPRLARLDGGGMFGVSRRQQSTNCAAEYVPFSD